jgi:hypothetical protein
MADGRIVDTFIVSIELLCGPQVKDKRAFLLPATIGTEIQKGAEIWITPEE